MAEASTNQKQNRTEDGQLARGLQGSAERVRP
jgi:hypothetical protein